MRRIAGAAMLLIASLCGLSSAQSPMKILVLYGAGDGGHSPMVLAGKPVLEKMGATNGFTIEFSGDKSVLTDANLEKYGLFMMINQYPFELNASQRAALQKWVESGKGWVGIHSTGCAQGDWPWYSKLLGDVTWVGHANLRNGTLLFEDRTHPVTRNMPASITLTEEWYQFSKSPRPNARVLAKAGNTGNASYDNGGDHPMVWCSAAYPKTVYISPGHDASDWKNADYVTLVHDAIAWAAAAPTPIGMNRNVTPRATQPRLRLIFEHGTLRFESGVGGDNPEVRLRIIDAAGRSPEP
jgi:type 1 glutamine amidotransferase